MVALNLCQIMAYVSIVLGHVFLNGTKDKITVYTKTVFGEDMVADTYAYRMENMFIELLWSKN